MHAPGHWGTWAKWLALNDAHSRRMSPGTSLGSPGVCSGAHSLAHVSLQRQLKDLAAVDVALLTCLQMTLVLTKNVELPQRVLQ